MQWRIQRTGWELGRPLLSYFRAHLSMHRLILLNSKEKIRIGELSILVNIARSFRVGIVCVIS